MKASLFLKDISKYGYNWFIVMIPSIISFLIVGPFNDIPECFRYGHEIGFITATLSLSVSAAGIFHFLLVFRPSRIRARKTLEIINAHIGFLDTIILELINIIDPTIDHFDQLKPNMTSFVIKVEKFKFKEKALWNSNTIGLQMDGYNKLFSSALVRFENIRDAMIFNPDGFDADNFEKISDCIFYREYFIKENLDDKTYQICFLNTIEFYSKLSLSLKQKIKNF